jgi:Xaa-Pro dipeptidase
MLIEAKHRTEILQAEMQTRGISHAVFTSESSIAYLAGFWGYTQSPRAPDF